jgi:hypothetical protein
VVEGSGSAVDLISETISRLRQADLALISQRNFAHRKRGLELAISPERLAEASDVYRVLFPNKNPQELSINVDGRWQVLEHLGRPLDILAFE